MLPSPATTPYVSSATPPAQNLSHSGDQDFQVQPQRPILNVVVVETGTVLNRGVPAQTVNLGPTREADRHPMTGDVAGDVAGELGDEVWTLRARSDQTHLPAEDVPKL